jgi:hypothetical protein
MFNGIPLIPIRIPMYHGASASLAIRARENVALLNAGLYHPFIKRFFPLAVVPAPMPDRLSVE